MFLLASLSATAVDVSTSVISAAGSTTTAPVPLPGWAQIVVLVFSAAVMYVLIPFIKNKALAAKAEADSLKADAASTNMNQRQALLMQAQAYALTVAANIAEREFPKLAAKIAAGELKTKESIKAEMYIWGKDLKTETIKYFKVQGIDIIASLGDTAIDSLIEYAANKVSPFPGKETAEALLKDGAQMLINKGVEYAKANYLK